MYDVYGNRKCEQNKYVYCIEHQPRIRVHGKYVCNVTNTKSTIINMRIEGDEENMEPHDQAQDQGIG